MGKSSGARPKKAVKQEVDALKRELGTIQSWEWQRAQVVFDRIVEFKSRKRCFGTLYAYSLYHRKHRLHSQ